MEPHLALNTARVYLEYPVNDPPPHPGPEWSRFVCISDTHSRRFPVPPGDVLLHAGDLCARGTVTDLKVTMEWLQTLEHGVKVYVIFSA
jgi:predicted MPP superfamily phosphohydrolase